MMMKKKKKMNGRKALTSLAIETYFIGIDNSFNNSIKFIFFFFGFS